MFDAAKANAVPAWVVAANQGCDISGRKIFAAEEAREGQFPWQVSVGNAYGLTPYSGHHCGGTIYRGEWVITAKHCVTGFNVDDLRVSFGSLVLSDGLRRFSVSEVLVPTPVDGQAQEVALVKVVTAGDAGFAGASIPALATQADEDQLATDLTPMQIAGWGQRFVGQGAFESLGYADLEMWTRERCSSPVMQIGPYAPDLLCAGAWDKPRQQTCSGDSGGGLVAGTGTSAKLVGVLYGGPPCIAALSQPDLFTRVSLYRQWIDDCTSDAPSCVATKREGSPGG